MKAMIFAAGLGTRLKPLTNNIPKALVEINGVTMLERVIKKLIHYGFNDIIINVHYFADKVTTFLNEHKNFGVNIEISDETGLLLDTGGGLKKASWFFNDGKPFLLHNVDIISGIDLGELYKYHQENNPLVTLAVQNRHSSRKLLFNRENLLCGWVNHKNGDKKIARTDSGLKEFAFNGIHIIDPAIFKFIYEDGVFSVIDLYIRLAATQNIICYHGHESGFVDIGTPEELERASGMGLSEF